MTETIPLSGADETVGAIPPAERSTEEVFDELFSSDKFDRSVQWTQQGSAEGLDEKTAEALNQLLVDQPSEGVLTIKRLPDGGYKIKTYKSNS